MFELLELKKKKKISFFITAIDLEGLFKIDDLKLGSIFSKPSIKINFCY